LQDIIPRKKITGKLKRFQVLNMIRRKEDILIEKKIEEKGSLEQNC